VLILDDEFSEGCMVPEEMPEYQYSDPDGDSDLEGDIGIAITVRSPSVRSFATEQPSIPSGDERSDDGCDLLLRV
jgi:hypothetical protein